MVEPEERSKIAILLTINCGLLFALLLATFTKLNMQLEIHFVVNATERPETSSVIKNSSIFKSRLEILKNPLPFDEAVEHCQLFRKKLPTPNSQKEEDELVEELAKLNYCSSYYLGYKASLTKRYIKLGEHIHLRSLEVLPDASKPNPRDICIGIQRDFCMDFVQCGNISGRCFLKSILLLDRFSKCKNDIHAVICWELDVVDKTMTPIEYLNKYKNNNEIGLLPLTKKLPPKIMNILQTKASSLCAEQYLAIGVGIKIDLEYHKIDSEEIMNYVSKRFIITDPTYNCLVLNKKENYNFYNLTTESCLNPACVICV